MSSRRHKCGSRAGRWGSPANAPHFFKIILSTIVEKQKLRIPKKFIRKYGKNLSRSIILKVPGGAAWHVESKTCDGEVWLERGWQEFSEHYSIGYGHFLVFRYEGKSRFHVLIFDKSACEIEYPYHSSHGKETNLDNEFKVPQMEESEDDVVSVEILDDFSCSRHKGKEKIPSQCAKESSGCILDNPRRLQSKVLEERPADADKVSAQERAKAFKSENPCFIVTMQPSYVSSNSNLNMPMVFVRRYFSEKHNNVLLRVSDEKTWSAKYCYGSGNTKLYNGWMKFALDNHLKVGDVCVFELIKQVENSLKVIIFKASEDVTQSKDHVS